MSLLRQALGSFFLYLVDRDNASLALLFGTFLVQAVGRAAHGGRMLSFALQAVHVATLVFQEMTLSCALKISASFHYAALLLRQDDLGRAAFRHVHRRLALALPESIGV